MLRDLERTLPRPDNDFRFPSTVLPILSIALFWGLGVPVAGASTPAQDPIPNGDFEDWGARSPRDFAGFQPPNGLFQTVYPSTEAHSGGQAVRLESVAFMGQTFNGGIFYCRGGCQAGASERSLEFPVTRQADAICGHYKASLLGGDRLMVNLVYRLGERPFAGTDQGDSQHAFLTADTSEWTPFRIPITAAPGDEETIPDRALLQIALFGPGYPRVPTDFGTAGSQAWIDRVRFCDDVVDLEVERPGVLGGTPVDDSIEAAPGIQTFVNLDNDDGDDLFDHDPDPARVDPEVVDDDELVPLRSRLEPLVPGKTIARLAIAGSDHIRLWKTASKQQPFDADRDLEVPGDFEADDDGYWLDLWVEGIEPQGPLEETSFHLTWDVLPEEDDLVRLAVLGVEKIELRGDGNGFTGDQPTAGPPRHDGDVLDDDPKFPAGAGIRALRVFPGARIDDIQDAKDTVHVDVTLSRTPVEDFDLYLRAFDLDDPSNSPVLDPNDGGCSSPGACSYDGTGGLEYTAEDDNRARVDKAGEFDSMDAETITELAFAAGQREQTVSFRVSQQPGDSYRLVANGDKDFLEQLRNLDAEDGLEIVDPRMNHPKPEDRAVRLPDFYASPVLTVWRLLHIESDSMVAVDVDANTVEGALQGAKAGRGALWAETVDVGDLTRGDGSRTLEEGGKGRFENGTLWVGHDRVVTRPLVGNGHDYVRGPDSGAPPGIAIPVVLEPGSPSGTASAPPPGPITGWVRRFAGTRFELGFEGTELPGRDYVGGTLNVAGTEMKIARIDLSQSLVEVVQALPIPFELVDDDDMSLLPRRPDLSTTREVYQAAYVLPLDDGGGRPQWSSNNVPFQLNITVDDASALRVIDAHRQSTAESSSFWVVYVLNAYQSGEHYLSQFAPAGAEPEGDEDPDESEKAVTGYTAPSWVGDVTVACDRVARGGEGSIVFVESERDAYSQDPPGADRDHAENVAHEIGHQFGLCHRPRKPGPDDATTQNPWGLMHPQLHGQDGLLDESIYYIRGRIESPGRSTP